MKTRVIFSSSLAMLWALCCPVYWPRLRSSFNAGGDCAHDRVQWALGGATYIDNNGGRDLQPGTSEEKAQWIFDALSVSSASVTRMEEDHVEPLSMMHYRKGDFFWIHTDPNYHGFKLGRGGAPASSQKSQKADEDYYEEVQSTFEYQYDQDRGKVDTEKLDWTIKPSASKSSHILLKTFFEKYHHPIPPRTKPIPHMFNYAQLHFDSHKEEIGGDS